MNSLEEIINKIGDISIGGSVVSAYSASLSVGARQFGTISSPYLDDAILIVFTTSTSPRTILTIQFRDKSGNITMLSIDGNKYGWYGGWGSFGNGTSSALTVIWRAYKIV